NTERMGFDLPWDHRLFSPDDVPNSQVEFISIAALKLYGVFVRRDFRHGADVSAFVYDWENGQTLRQVAPKLAILDQRIDDVLRQSVCGHAQAGQSSFETE